MFKVGELVKWRCPLDEDYSYGKILDIKRSVATVEGTNYYTGVISEVHLRYIEKLERGELKGNGAGKKHNKRSTP